MQFADVGAVAVVRVGLVVDDLQLAVLVDVAVVPLDVAVRVPLLVPELPVVSAGQRSEVRTHSKQVGRASLDDGPRPTRGSLQLLSRLGKAEESRKSNG